MSGVICLISDVRYRMPYDGYQNQCQRHMSDFRYLMSESGVRCQKLDVRFHITHIISKVLGVRCQMSDIRCQLSVFQMSDFRFQMLDARCQIFSVSIYCSTIVEDLCRHVCSFMFSQMIAQPNGLGHDRCLPFRQISQ